MFSKEKAQAIHVLDEAWTELIDKLRAKSQTDVAHQIKVMRRWRKTGIPKSGLGPVARKNIAELAWLALAEAAVRALDDRNNESGKWEA